MAHVTILSASILMDYRLLNRQGQLLGEIEEIAMDLARSCIAYVVVSCFDPNCPNKVLAVPWNALKLDHDSQAFVLDIDEKAFRDAPCFDRDNWPDLGNDEWGRAIAEYYNVQPYWHCHPFAGHHEHTLGHREGY